MKAKNNFTSFKMNPVIRLISEANSGAISGSVNDASALPVAYAIVGNDTVTSTPVDTSTSLFKLGFLPADTYTVAVSDTSNRSGSVNGVEVVVGEDNDIGEITIE